MPIVAHQYAAVTDQPFVLAIQASEGCLAFIGTVVRAAVGFFRSLEYLQRGGQRLFSFCFGGSDPEQLTDEFGD